MSLSLVLTVAPAALAAPPALLAASLDPTPAKRPPSLPPPPPPAPTASGVGQTTTTGAPAAAAPETARTAGVSSGGDKRFIVIPTLGFSTDDLNLGLGLRVGRMLTDRIYVGGAFVYHLGKSETATAAPGYTATSSFSAFYVGPEVGYDFDVAPVVVRAYAGLGLAALTASANAGGVSVSNTDTKFVFWPGASVLYDLPDSSYFVGGDARLVFIPGGPALGVFALAGTRF